MVPTKYSGTPCVLTSPILCENFRHFKWFFLKISDLASLKKDLSILIMCEQTNTASMPGLNIPGQSIWLGCRVSHIFSSIHRLLDFTLFTIFSWNQGYFKSCQHFFAILQFLAILHFFLLKTHLLCRNNLAAITIDFFVWQ